MNFVYYVDFEKCHVTPANIRKVAVGLNPIPLWGDGTEVRDVIHVDDMVSGFATVAEKVDTYDIYNWRTLCYQYSIQNIYNVYSSRKSYLFS